MELIAVKKVPNPSSSLLMKINLHFDQFSSKYRTTAVTSTVKKINNDNNSGTLINAETLIADSRFPNVAKRKRRKKKCVKYCGMIINIHKLLHSINVMNNLYLRHLWSGSLVRLKSLIHFQSWTLKKKKKKLSWAFGDICAVERYGRIFWFKTFVDIFTFTLMMRLYGP